MGADPLRVAIQIRVLAYCFRLIGKEKGWANQSALDLECYAA